MQRSRIARRVLLLAVAALIQGPAYGFGGERGGEEPEAAEPGAHKFHVSYGRMAVEENRAMLQIRLFKDDLEVALRQKFEEPDFTLAVNPHSDSLFIAYFNEVFVLKQDEVAVPGQIISSGEDQMAGEPMWWYTVSFEAPAVLKTFTVRDVVLFELFDDQKNIFKVRHFPSEKEFSYYFADGAEEYKISF